MIEPSLKTKIWVQANIRKCMSDGINATVVRRGDDDAGIVLVKIYQRELGFSVLSQTRNLDGELIWQRVTGPDPVPEPDADAYIERQLRYDQDLWVLEIENPAGGLPFGDEVF